MDSKSTPNIPTPNEMTVPEEDATLLAIEALEARTVDDYPKPLDSPQPSVVPPRPVVAPPAPPKAVDVTIEPAAKPVVKQPVVQPAPKPAPGPTPIEVFGTPKPKPLPPTPKIAEVKPAPVQEKSKKPSTPAEEMAEELESAPTTSRFQFFANQKPPRKPFIIVAIVVVLIGVGVAVYFATTL